MKTMLRIIRESRGYTQRYMARKTKIPVATYSQYEAGTRSIPFSIATEISKELGVRKDVLFQPAKYSCINVNVPE